jgi:hypothetical protein
MKANPNMKGSEIRNSFVEMNPDRRQLTIFRFFLIIMLYLLKTLPLLLLLLFLMDKKKKKMVKINCRI